MLERPSARLGDWVAGRYRLDEVAGRGGMSVVYRAHDIQTGDQVAIKILLNGLPANIDAGARLEQEARVILRIDDPHVVRLLDTGQTGGGQPFFVMEHLDGVSLARAFSDRSPMAPGRFLNIIRQVLEGLKAAHAMNIIHRDIKPENVLLITRDGVPDFVKMLDFGIAKIVGDASAHSVVQTARGVVLGTPEYLPPEIALDLPVTPATDIYAVGIILFEGLTGRLPFNAQSAAQLAEQHCFTPPPLLRPFNPAITEALEAVVLDCLAKEPERRPPTAGALWALLEPFTHIASVDSMASTIDNGPVGRGRGDLDCSVIEAATRAVVEVRYPERLPDGLARKMSKLDGASAKLDRLNQELRRIDTELDGLGDAPRRATHSVPVTRGRLDERQRELRVAERELLRQLEVVYGASNPAAAVLSASIGLSTEVPDRYGRLAVLAEQMGFEDSESLEAELRALMVGLQTLAEELAESGLEIAQAEAHLVLARASWSAAHGRLVARREALTLEVQIAQRQCVQTAGRCLLALEDAPES